MNERICGEYALLTGLSPCDGLQYVNDQISAHSKSLKARVEVYKQHPGQRDLIEGFIDHKIQQIALLRKMQNVLVNNNNQLNSETMESEIFHYQEEDYLNNKRDIADAFCALYFAYGLSPKQRESISHCLSVLNDFLEAVHDGKTIAYHEEDEDKD